MPDEQNFDVLVVGGGIFGASAALELQGRGLRAALLDPGPLPHPLAASTDISKVVRIEYADDPQYARLAEQARLGWLKWNDWLADEPLYHEVGMLLLTSQPMAPGEYEYESRRSLLARGYGVDPVDGEVIARRFPAFNADLYVDGYYHADAGYAESGRVVSALLRRVVEAGAEVLPGHKVVQILTDRGRVQGVRTAEGRDFQAGSVIVAAGAWTPYLVPELSPVMRSVGMPVFHLKPSEPALFEAARFPVFSADVTRTGWYGFPLHPDEKVVKIANHGVGVPVHPDKDERVVTDSETDALRAWLKDAIPPLADDPIVYTRRCLYCDTLDENFWIDRHPEIRGLIVAAGGSGHAFKFGPLLGGWIADALEGKPDPDLAKFRWRELSSGTQGTEASRYREAL